MEKFTFDNLIVTASDLPPAEYAKLNEGNRSDLTVLSHNSLSDPVNLFDEMSGKEKKLKEFAELSAKEKSTVIAGITLCYGGIKRLSAVIAHNGELIDIADSCSVSEPYSRSNTVKIYSNGNTKTAVLIGGDARVRFIMQKLATACTLAVSLEPEYRPENEQRIRKLSNEFKLPVLYVSPLRIFFAQPDTYLN